MKIAIIISCAMSFSKHNREHMLRNCSQRRRRGVKLARTKAFSRIMNIFRKIACEVDNDVGKLGNVPEQKAFSWLPVFQEKDHFKKIAKNL